MTVVSLSAFCIVLVLVMHSTGVHGNRVGSSGPGLAELSQSIGKEICIASGKACENRLKRLHHWCSLGGGHTGYGHHGSHYRTGTYGCVRCWLEAEGYYKDPVRGMNMRVLAQMRDECYGRTRSGRHKSRDYGSVNRPSHSCGRGRCRKCPLCRECDECPGARGCTKC